MKSFLLILIIVIISSATTFAQKGKDQILLSVDNQNYSLDEFMYVYNKNNGNSSVIDKKSMNEYLDLYINFRLKVKEAEDRGMDTSVTFVNELKGYRDQLAKPYLVDKTVDDLILKEAYDRLQWDVRASHIMISVPEGVSKNDTMAIAAYDKLMNIRKQILNGSDFGEMAKKYSDDPSARDMPASRSRGEQKGNGGDLGYFTAFYMVYPFETAVYNTAVGDISLPIRTQYGYHIIRVTDKIPSLGKIEVKHINCKPKAMDEQSDEAAKAKINEILTMINAGKITFEEAAKQFSDDKGSAVNGGVLPAFEVSRMVPEFIQAISKLQPDSISSPVKTEYGWHLIKLVNTVKLPAYEEYLPTLKSKVNRDSRSNMSKESAVEKFKSEFKFKEYAKNLSKFYDAVDSSIFKQQWKAENAAAYNAVLFKLDKKSYTQTDFAIYLENHQKPIKSATIRYYIDRIYDQWIEETVMQYKDSKLESQNVDFRMLVNEYHDGILLFAISDEEVWGKAVRDTAGLRDFHAKNAEKYIWGERVEATIYKCVDEAVAKEVSAMLNAGIVLDSIVKKVNSKSALSLHFERGKYEAGNSSAIDQIKKQKGVSPILTIGSSFVIVDVQTILPVQNKTLDEARGLITADYQNYLEKKWLEKLHSTHSITINKELLEKE